MKDHIHIPLKQVKGHWTFHGKGKPSKKLLEVIEKMAKLAYENADNLI